VDACRSVTGASGAIGDYVTWLMVGMTVLGGLFALVVR
jgi:hypothetical protein